MKTNSRWRAPALAAAALLAATPGPEIRADNGRIPVWQQTTINAPGNYVLTRDITSPGIAILIQATDVSLDLNGHTVTSTGSGSFPVYVFPPTGGRGLIEVRNGQLRDGTSSLYYDGVRAPSGIVFRLERVDLSTTGTQPTFISMLSNVEILNCTLHDIPGTSPALDVDSGSVTATFTGRFEGNTVSRVGGTAIRLRGMTGGSIRQNVIQDYGSATAGTGLSLEGSSVGMGGTIVEGNAIRKGGASSIGLYLGVGWNRCSVSGNVIESAGVGMMVWALATRISGNTVGSTQSGGIQINNSQNTIERNLVDTGNSSGIIFASFAHANLVDGNTVQGHQAFGLVFQGFLNAYRGNMLRNNFSGAVSGSATDAGGNIP